MIKGFEIGFRQSGAPVVSSTGKRLCFHGLSRAGNEFVLGYSALLRGETNSRACVFFPHLIEL